MHFKVKSLACHHLNCIFLQEEEEENEEEASGTKPPAPTHFSALDPKSMKV